MSRTPKPTAMQETLALIPQHERDNLADVLEKTDQRDYAAVAKSARALLVSLVRGHLHPEVSMEARALLELELMSIAAADPKRNTVTNASAVLISVLQDTQRALPEIAKPKYIDVAVDEPPSSPEVNDVIPIVAKK